MFTSNISVLPEASLGYVTADDVLTLIEITSSPSSPNILIYVSLVGLVNCV